MFAALIAFTDLLLASLLVGAVFGVWLSFRVAGLNAPAYVLHHQHAVRAVNVVLPALGAVTILLTIGAALLAHDDRRRLVLFGAAVACFMFAALITRLANQPINAVVMTWSADAPPADWARWRDAWWRWHRLRLAVSVGGLGFLIAASLRQALF